MSPICGSTPWSNGRSARTSCAGHKYQMAEAKVSLYYTTFPDQTSAEDICRKLVQERLIACANIFPPMVSLYWWSEKIEKKAEVAAILKTRQGFFKKLLERYESLHPYTTPCLVEIAVAQINPSYREWLISEVR
ncbi:MAG: divalent-cation tolerance protein CutA [Bdellovibrio sp.]|nr:MAG: divalent-cation tolerance protein CutA [Bdellovibrio sp.]